MNAVLTLVRERTRSPVALAVGAVVLIAIGAIAFFSQSETPDEQTPEQRLFVKSKRAVTGQKIKLDNDQEEYVMLAGIRAPVGGEPLYEEATKRANDFVEDKKIRLRFDEAKRDSDGRLLGYVFLNDEFLNEILVMEGLAFARVTPDNDRFAQRLIAAQESARKGKKGLWSKRTPGALHSYSADPKYGNFHRPGCEEEAKIPTDRLVRFAAEKDALAKGFAPCAKCKP